MLCTMCSAALFILLISSNLQSSLSTNLTFFYIYQHVCTANMCVYVCVCG